MQSKKRATFLPFALPDFDESELHAIREALQSGWITTGPKTRRFEKRFARYVGANHAVAVNSCTAAMHLALEAVGLEPGDMVITTPYTFAATAEVIRYFQAEPVFVDVDEDTLNISTDSLRREVDTISSGKGKKKTGEKRGKLRAVLPVHLAGLPCDMDAVYGIAEVYDVAVVEDAAHAFPAKHSGRFIGSSEAGRRIRSPRFTCFSFYATKTITTGEGGMLVTPDESLAERCRIMSLHGISRDAWKRYMKEGDWYYEIIAPGYKYNMTDVAAAMGLAQLEKAERMWQRRTEIAHRYNQAFSEMPELQLPAENPEHQHAWHLYMLRLNLEHLRIDRRRFIEELKKRNIGASVHFIPLHLHPYYRDQYGYRPEDFPVATREYQREISLPIYSRMTDRDVTDVIESVVDVVENHRV